jgi:glutamate racemase
VVGVLATPATLRSARFQALVERHAAGCRILCQPGHGLVETVERCDVSPGSPALIALLRGYLQPMLDAGADTLVLGCTHYPFLDQAIHAVIGEKMQLIDTSVAIARQLQRVLMAHHLQNAAAAVDGNRFAPVRFCSTNDGVHLHQLAAALLGIDAPVAHVDIPSRRTASLETHVA